MNLRKNLYIGLLLVIVFFSCRGGGGDGSVVKTNDDDLTGEDSIGLVIDTNIEVEIGNVNFFLENSMSMAGYIYFPTQFSKDIDNILVNLHSIFPNKISPYTIGKGVHDYEKDLDVFREDLNPTNRKRISIDDSSLLDKIIGDVLEQTNDDELSILVTDAIMSGSNKDLSVYDDPAEDLYFNIANVDVRLKGDINMAVSKHKDDNKAIKIYGYKSDFVSGKRVSGKRYYYYKADNNKYNEQLIGTLPNRPYYLFLIGSPEHIRAFEKKAGHLLRPAKTVELGFGYASNGIKLTNNYAKRKNVRLFSNVAKDIHEIEIKKTVKKDEDQPAYLISLLVNLEGLDPMFTTQEYLERNISFQINGLNKASDIEAIDLLTDNSKDHWANNTSRSEYRGYTHLIIVEIDEYQPDIEDEIVLQLINNTEDWVKDWSNDNDLNMSLDDATTFGFQYLVQGIKEAYYSTSNIYLLEKKLTIKKLY